MEGGLQVNLPQEYVNKVGRDTAICSGVHIPHWFLFVPVKVTKKCTCA
jgi:hypothetical protein